MEAIRNHPRMKGLTKRAIYYKIAETRSQIGTWHSKRAAAAYLASTLEIDVYKLLRESPEQLAELQNIGTPTSIERQQRVKVVKEIKESRPISISDNLIDTYGLPSNLDAQAKKMSRVYPYFYVFENLLRYIISSILEDKYGKNWWERATIGRDKREQVRDRRRAEGRNRWVGRRGSHAIFYTDLGDLGLIINSNYNAFKKTFPSLGWIKQRIDDIEQSRNILAHNNPLPKKEIDRVKMYLNDLQDILKSRRID